MKLSTVDEFRNGTEHGENGREKKERLNYESWEPNWEDRK